MMAIHEVKEIPEKQQRLQGLSHKWHNYVVFCASRIPYILLLINRL